MNRSLLALATSILVAGGLGVSCADNEPDDSTPDIMGGSVGTGGNGETGGTDPGSGGESLGGEGGRSDCAPTQKLCDSFCSSTGSDPLHCGTCDNECATGEGCLGGECADFGCSTGQVTCDDTCTNLQSDRSHCGDCDTECESGEVCDSGLCATSCSSGRIECDGGCIDPMTDRSFCGADSCDSAAGGAGGAGAGVACADGEVCIAGSCTTACPAGQIVCDNRCVDVSNNRDFCGATDCGAAETSGEECKSGEICSSGVCTTSCPSNQIVCDDRCVDPNTDRLFCGASDDCVGANDGESCGDGTICSAGSCETSCQSGYEICNDKCIDPTINLNFCGATDCSAPATDGDVCSPGEICLSGACESWCPTGQVSCGDKCVDPETDRNFCGAVLNSDCEGANAGEVCGGGEYCVDAECDPTCPLGYLVCGDKCVDPLSNDEFCGATDCGSVMTSGQTCTTEQSCVVGECRGFLFEWTQGVPISPDGKTVDNHQVMGTDSLGNTLVAWKQFETPGDLTTLTMYARRYMFATKTWTPAVQIAPGGGVQVRNPALAVADNGDAYLAWENTAGAIFGAAFDGSTNTWATAVRLDSQTEDVDSIVPAVGVDAIGSAWIAWSEATDLAKTTYRTVRRYFDATTGTLGAQEMLSGYGETNSLKSYSPVVRMNPNGDTILIWVDENTSDTNLQRTLMAAVKPAGSAWGSPQALSPSEIFRGYGDPDAGIDDQGRAYVVWLQADVPNLLWNVRMRKFDGTSWGITVDVESEDGRMRFPRIATDSVGNSVVTFFKSYHATSRPDGPWYVYAARVDSDLNSTLSLLRTVPDPTPADVHPPWTDFYHVNPNVVLDDAGNSHVMWSNGGTIETSMFNRLRGSWSAYQILASGAGNAYGAAASASHGGRAYSIWYQGGRIYGARYD